MMLDDDKKIADATMADGTKKIPVQVPIPIPDTGFMLSRR
jgi:hypothetical protein